MYLYYYCCFLNSCLEWKHHESHLYQLFGRRSPEVEKGIFFGPKMQEKSKENNERNFRFEGPIQLTPLNDHYAGGTIRKPFLVQLRHFLMYYTNWSSQNAIRDIYLKSLFSRFDASNTVKMSKITEFRQTIWPFWRNLAKAKPTTFLTIREQSCKKKKACAISI